MMKLKKFGFGLCVIVLVVILGLYLIESYRLSAAKTAAIQYVKEKYDFDVECVGGEFRWIDPSQYHIWLQSKNEEKTNFTVLVEPDLTVQKEERVAYGKRYTADNYLSKRFAQEVGQYIKKVLEEDKNLEEVLVWFGDPGLYAFSVPVTIDSTSRLDEVLREMNIRKIALYYNGLDESVGKEKLEDVVKTLESREIRTKWITAYDANGQQKLAEVERQENG